MGDFSIKVDAKDVLGFFDSLSKQAPFATSLAINNVMKLGQQREQAHLGEAFTLRRQQFIERTVKILQFANKRTLTGVIGIDPTRDVLAKFEDQGVKRPTSGSALAVPISVKRGKTDIVVKNMRVRALELRPVRSKSGEVTLKGKYGTFTVKTPTGGAILQRTGKGQVKVLYAFKRSVPLPKNLEFTQHILSAVDEWPSIMGDAWDQAERTAK